VQALRRVDYDTAADTTAQGHLLLLGGLLEADDLAIRET
jgi:hypothetical protein